MERKGGTPDKSATYSPGGVAEFRAYKARLQRPVDDGHLTDGEAHILQAIKMQGIQLDGGSGKSIREPRALNNDCARFAIPEYGLTN